VDTLSVMRRVVVDMAMAKQRPLTDDATESDVDSDADDSVSLDSSPFASPRQPRAQPLITSASAFELASLANDDSSGQFALRQDAVIIEHAPDSFVSLTHCNILTSPLYF